MTVLKGKYNVTKRNILNEIRSNNMTLQELRLFSIYLSKINPKDISTRVVRFPLDDFCNIMELGKDMNIPHFRMTIRRILQQIVEVPNEKGSGYTAFQLFKQAEVEKDENGEWYVEFDAHDRALPLMFDFKRNFFEYQLWNALRLKSANQIRMYEVLKQWLNKKSSFTKEFSVKELRELLYIAPDDYSGRTGWSDFRKYVLDSCQQALKQHTDLCYTYERGKAGRGGKWLTIVFHISKNKDYDGQMVLDEFLPVPEPAPDTLGEDGEFVGQMTFDTLTAEQDCGSDELERYAEACERSFKAQDLAMIDKAIKTHKSAPEGLTERVEWLQECYGALVVEEANKARKGKKISDRAKYLVKIIEKSTPPEPKQKPSYDLDKWHEMAESLDLGSISFGEKKGE